MKKSPENQDQVRQPHIFFFFVALISNRSHFVQRCKSFDVGWNDSTTHIDLGQFLALRTCVRVFSRTHFLFVLSL